MKTRLWYLAGVFMLLNLLNATVAGAQADDAFLLSLNKTAGYNDFEGNIQGTFTLSVAEVPGLVEVAFWIDGGEMGQAGAAPFKLKFNTGNYTPGVHTLSASGTTSGDGLLHSNEIRARFITAGEARQKTFDIVMPIFGVVFGAILLSLVIPLAMGWCKPGETGSHPSGEYGLLGGAICPNCRQPFGLHLWGLNMIAGKLDRCPHCGRWSVVRRAGKEELAAADGAKGQEGKGFKLDEIDHTRRELDESRYMDE